MNLEQIGDKVRGFLPAATQIADIASTIAAVIPGASEVVGGIKLAIKIANGLANEVPEAVKAWNDLQAARAGGKLMTADELAQLEADIDAAHSAFLAAADKVING